MSALSDIVSRMSPATRGAWEADPLRLTIEAVATQRMAALDCPRRTAAVHETSHCVVYRAEDEAVLATLRNNRATVEAIAGHFFRRGNLKGARLDRLLAEVRVCHKAAP